MPAACAHVASRAERQFWRDQRLDTVYYPRTGLRLQPSTVAGVKQCVARFDRQHVQFRDLLGLGQGYLAADQDRDADATFAQLATQTPRADKAWMLYQIVDSYLSAAQPRLLSAQVYLTRLEALGASAAPERMLAHTALAEHARLRDSVPLETRELDAALRTMHEMTGDMPKEYAPASAEVYIARAALKARQNDATGARAELERGRSELVPLRQSVSKQFDRVSPLYQLLGTRASAVKATQWFNVEQSGIQHPTAGKPSLLVFVSHSCGGGCYTKYAILKRLVAKYGSRLDVTLMARTEGFYRNELVSPDTGIVRMKAYFLDYLKLPGTLAIWHAPLGHRGDGRITVLSSPNNDAFQPSGAVFLVDSNGIIRMTATLTTDNEAMLDDVIRSIL